ncbi:MAG: hypothetical protein U9R26_04540 [Campylobacterota bacterium]|nr:hypothetical protein [Campylobacterota bacterium]
MNIYTLILFGVLLIWPVIVSICCLIIKHQEITSKVKYFLISVLVGYWLILAVYILADMISGVIPQNILILLFFLPTLIYSYKLASESKSPVKLEKKNNKESIDLKSLPLIQEEEIPTGAKFHALSHVDENGVQLEYKAYLDEIGNELIITIVINHNGTYKLYDKKKFNNARELGEYLKHSTKFLLTDFA